MDFCKEMACALFTLSAMCAIVGIVIAISTFPGGITILCAMVLVAMIPFLFGCLFMALGSL